MYSRRFWWVLALVSLFVSVFALPLHAQVDELTTVTINTTQLNVREQPNVNSRVVALARQGEVYEVLGQTSDEDWYQINANGVIGWVSAVFVRVRTTVYVPLPVTVTPIPTPVTPQPCVTNHPLFFNTSDSTICPTEQAVGTGASYQRFQSGWMIWLENTKDIYVFSSYGVQRIPESAYAIFPAHDEIAPAGFYAPVRGFGRVWANLPDVRQRLGWATGLESGYNAVVQGARSNITGEAIMFIMLPDGGVVGAIPEQNIWYAAG